MGHNIFEYVIMRQDILRHQKIIVFLQILDCPVQVMDINQCIDSNKLCTSYQVNSQKLEYHLSSPKVYNCLCRIGIWKNEVSCIEQV